MAKPTASLVSFCALVVFAALQPLAGALSDRIGRRPLLITFAVGATFLTVPIMTLLKHAGGFWPALGLSLLGLVIVTGYTSINACVKAELFPTGIRALGVALPTPWPPRCSAGRPSMWRCGSRRAAWSPVTTGMWRVVRRSPLVVYLTMRETRDIDLKRVGRDETEPARPDAVPHRETVRRRAAPRGSMPLMLRWP